MFRDMRRFKQALTPTQCEAVLKRGTSGVLALAGDDGYPYAVPISYCYDNGKLWFHCALEGHKLDAIAHNEKVSFCVIDQDVVVPEKYTTCFRSVILFGKARILTDEAEKRTAFEALAAKYTPDDAAGRKNEIEKNFARTLIVEITVQHITGKEAIELARQKEAVQNDNVL